MLVSVRYLDGPFLGEAAAVHQSPRSPSNERGEILEAWTRSRGNKSRLAAALKSMR